MATRLARLGILLLLGLGFGLSRDAAPSPPVAAVASLADIWGRPHVTVVLPGEKPLQLLLDTGAGASIINESDFRALGLPPMAMQIGRVGMGGADMDGWIVTLPWVRLGTCFAERVKFIVLPFNQGVLEGSAGILGVDGMRRIAGVVPPPATGALEIDWRSNLVVFDGC